MCTLESFVTVSACPMAADATAVPVETFRVTTADGEGLTLPRLTLRDRRAAGAPQLHWIFQRHLESVLYNRISDGGTSGAIWKILNATGL